MPASNKGMAAESAHRFQRTPFCQSIENMEIQMRDHEVFKLIKQADNAISVGDFDTLIDFYADDAILVVQPGQFAQGKPQIRKAFAAIHKHFKNALNVTQGAAHVIEGAGTALVIMETLLFVGDASEPIRRRATYVFRQDPSGAWLCTVDNSYGTDVLNTN